MKTKDISVLDTCKVMNTALTSLALTVRHESKTIELLAFGVNACDVKFFEKELVKGYVRYEDKHRDFTVLTYSWSSYPTVLLVKLFVREEVA